MLRVILCKPFDTAETGLLHRKPNPALHGIFLVELDTDDTGTDAVSLGKGTAVLFTDKLLVFDIRIDFVIHNLTDMDKTVDGSETDESTEGKDFLDHSFDYFVVTGLEHELRELYRLIDCTVSMNDFSIPDCLGVGDQHRDRAVLLKGALDGLGGNTADNTVDVLAETGRIYADDLSSLGHHVHRMPLITPSILPSYK